VIDIARRDRSAGLLSADAALRERLVSRLELAAAAHRCAGWPGSSGAAWVARHADPLSESPLESLTRACLILAGLPVPDLQVWIPEAHARVDLLYPEARVVIEADGLLKYTQPGALRAEKLRHERLTRAGYRVVRLMWADVAGDPSTAVSLVRSALAAQRGGLFL
jgi:very-short-patch-repair endonuclease